MKENFILKSLIFLIRILIAVTQTQSPTNYVLTPVNIVPSVNHKYNGKIEIIPNSRTAIYVDNLDGRSNRYGIYSVFFADNDAPPLKTTILVADVGFPSNCQSVLNMPFVLYNYYYIALINTINTSTQCTDYLSIYYYDNLGVFNLISQTPTGLNTMCMSYLIKSIVFLSNPNVFSVYIKCTSSIYNTHAAVAFLYASPNDLVGKTKALQRFKTFSNNNQQFFKLPSNFSDSQEMVSISDTYIMFPILSNGLSLKINHNATIPNKANGLFTQGSSAQSGILSYNNGLLLNFITYPNLTSVYCQITSDNIYDFSNFQYFTDYYESTDTIFALSGYSPDNWTLSIIKILINGFNSYNLCDVKKSIQIPDSIYTVSKFKYLGPFNTILISDNNNLYSYIIDQIDNTTSLIKCNFFPIPFYFNLLDISYIVSNKNNYYLISFGYSLTNTGLYALYPITNNFAICNNCPYILDGVCKTAPPSINNFKNVGIYYFTDCPKPLITNIEKCVQSCNSNNLLNTDTYDCISDCEANQNKINFVCLISCPTPTITSLKTCVNFCDLNSLIYGFTFCLDSKIKTCGINYKIDESYSCTQSTICNQGNFEIRILDGNNSQITGSICYNSNKCPNGTLESNINPKVCIGCTYGYFVIKDGSEIKCSNSINNFENFPLISNNIYITTCDNKNIILRNVNSKDYLSCENSNTMNGYCLYKYKKYYVSCITYNKSSADGEISDLSCSNNEFKSQSLKKCFTNYCNIDNYYFQDLSNSNFICIPDCTRNQPPLMFSIGSCSKLCLSGYFNNNNYCVPVCPFYSLNGYCYNSCTANPPNPADPPFPPNPAAPPLPPGYANLGTTCISQQKCYLSNNTINYKNYNYQCINNSICGLDQKMWESNNICTPCTDTFQSIINSKCSCNGKLKSAVEAKCYDKCPKIAPFIDTSTNTCYSNCPTIRPYFDQINGCTSMCSPPNKYVNNYFCYSYPNCFPFFFNLDPYNNFQCVDMCSKNAPYFDKFSGCVISCASNLYILNNLCLPECPPRYVYDNNRNCTICPNTSYLDITTNPNKCLVNCNPNTISYKGTCFPGCSNSTFFNTTSLNCSSCDISCNTCSTNATNCTSCSNGYIYMENTQNCYINCPDGSYKNSSLSLCKSCPSTCSKCSNNTLCLTCIINYNLVTKILNLNTNSYNILMNITNNTIINWSYPNITTASCEIYCPIGQYAFNGTCNSCKNNCYLCTGKYDCQQCGNGYNLLNNTCWFNCPKNYYSLSTINNDGRNIGNCLACSTNCSNCTSYKVCSSCPPNYFLLNNTCYPTCPDGYIINNNTFSCDNCFKNCFNCNGLTKNNCISCRTDLKLDNESGQCYKDCPDYQVKVNNKCIDVTSCFQQNNVMIPKIYNTKNENFTANFTYKIINCSENIIMPYITILWSDNYKEFNMTPINNNISYFSNDIKDFDNVVVEFYTDVQFNNNSIFFFDNSTLFLNQDLELPFKTNWSFFQGYPIILDACSTFDPTTADQNKDINFNWALPDLFNSSFRLNISQTSNCSLIINPSDYQNNIIIHKSFVVLLNISKYGIVYSKNLTIIVNKLDNIGQLFSINKTYENNHIIFQIESIDPKIDLDSFSYSWYIQNFTSDQYYYGNISDNIFVNKNDINNGSSITCNVTINETDYPVNYLYIKDVMPYGGTCIVDPPNGTYFKDYFTFSASNFSSPNTPLKYRFYYDNEIPFSDQYSFINVYENSLSNPIPFSKTNAYYLEVVDSIGLNTFANCTVNITQYNLSAAEITSTIDKISDISIKLNAITNLVSENTSMINNDENLGEIIFSSIDKYIDGNNSDFNKIGQLLPSLILTTDVVTSPKALNYLNTSINNFNPKNDNSYSIYKTIFIYSNKTSNDITNTLIAENLMDKLNGKIAATLFCGQNITKSNDFNTMIFFNPNRISDGLMFDVLTKVPNTSNVSLNTNSTTLMYRSLKDSRNLQSQNKNVCLYSLCIDGYDITEFLSNYPKSIFISRIDNENFKFFLQFTKFSKNSAKVIATNENSTIIENVKFPYSVRLNTNHFDKSNNSDYNKIKISFCAVLNQTSNFSIIDKSCISLFDYSNDQVICNCSYFGLVIVIKDANFANSFIEYQSSLFFGTPYLMANLFYCTLGLFGILLLALKIGSEMDYYDAEKLCIKKDENYDINQRNIIQFTKAGFHQEYNIRTLYFYLIDKFHPIWSVYTHYSPFYNRKTRILSLSLKFYILLCCCLLPFELIPTLGDKQRIYLRDVDNYATPNLNFEFDGKSIVYGFLISIAASMFSSKVGDALFFMIYQNMNTIEYERMKNRLKTYMEKYMKYQGKSSWTLKIKKARAKLKGFTCWMKCYREIQKNQSLDKNMRKNKEKVEDINNVLDLSVNQNNDNYIIENDENVREMIYNREEEEEVFNKENKKITNQLLIKKFEIEPTTTRDPIFSNKSFASSYELLNRADNEVSLNNIGAFEISSDNYFRKLNFNRCPQLESRSSENTQYLSKSLIKGNYTDLKLEIQNLKRKFRFPTLINLKNHEKISCFQIKIEPKTFFVPLEENTAENLKSHFRISLMMFLHLFIWYYMIISISSLYQSFGKYFYVYCVPPVIIMFLLHYVVFNLFSLYIQTLFVYYWGPTVYKEKGVTAIVFLYKIIVNSDVGYFHETITKFKEFNKRFFNKSRKLLSE